MRRRRPGAALPVEGGAVTMSLSGAQIAQAVIRTGPIEPAPPAAVAGFARYWLHNSGPAPTGNLPVSAHLEPPVATMDGPASLTVTVASSLATGTGGTVELEPPAGWTVSATSVPYHLPPGGHVRHTVTVSAPPASPAGVYWLRARIPGVVEDVVRLLVGVDRPESVTAAPVPPLRLRPGDVTAVELDLTTDAATPVTVDVQLIGPWHLWDVFPVADRRIELPAGGSARCTVPVAVPAGHGAGTWWALFKLMHGGELHYTEPFAVEVRP
jgi:alpha-mannosidase